MVNFGKLVKKRKVNFLKNPRELFVEKWLPGIRRAAMMFTQLWHALQSFSKDASFTTWLWHERKIVEDFLMHSIWLRVCLGAVQGHFLHFKISLNAPWNSHQTYHICSSFWLPRPPPLAKSNFIGKFWKMKEIMQFPKMQPRSERQMLCDLRRSESQMPRRPAKNLKLRLPGIFHDCYIQGMAWDKHVSA